ncbi:hypothetical protein [Bailinhaonella thermotolerans]|uniref:Uncharacterized protein n=1 Tax=Bailinhaonella thermotolerans TaxID=1070861 RepID=A0A3A4A5V0_9ACTN|nr:hypothetical protein [Bailinhaonella thermotolerans]RJL23935.1 hypothetical protein D5H75_31350 [Bailinhaonella thermotolerans]
MSYRVEFHTAALAQMGGLPDAALDALVSRVADLLERPWDARVIADDRRFRRTTFGDGRGLVSFYLDETAQVLRIFDVTWAG